MTAQPRQTSLPPALHPQLAKDTVAVVENAAYWLRLHKNALVPWLIIVPKTHACELIDCSPALKSTIYQLIETVGHYTNALPQIEKLNIASLGNVVPQLHIHVIGRHKGDFAWPEPVWGKSAFQAYSATQRNQLINTLQATIIENYRNSANNE